MMTTHLKTLDATEIIDSKPMGREQYVVFALCCMVMFVDGIDTQVFSFALPHIVKDWGLQKSSIGPLLSAALVGLLVGYTLISPLSQRFGHRRMLIVSTLWFGALTMLLPLTQTVAQMMALRFLSGIGLGVVLPSAMALTSEYTPKRLRASFIIYIHTGLGMGFLSAGVLAGFLLPRHGWHGLLLAGGVAAIIISAVLAWRLPESLDFLSRRGETDRVLDILRRVTGNPALTGQIPSPANEAQGHALVGALLRRGNIVSTCLLWFVFIVNLGLYYSIVLWLPSILPGLGYSPSVSITATTFASTASTLAVFVIGPAMDRFGGGRVVLMLYLIAMVMLLLTGFFIGMPAPVWLLLALVSLLGIGVGGGMKGINAIATMFYPANMRAVGTGWALGIGRMGAIAGPLLVGWLLGLGWPVMHIFYVAAIPTALAALMIFTLTRYRWRVAGPHIPITEEAERARVIATDDRSAQARSTS